MKGTAEAIFLAAQLAFLLNDGPENIFGDDGEPDGFEFEEAYFDLRTKIEQAGETTDDAVVGSFLAAACESLRAAVPEPGGPGRTREIFWRRLYRDLRDRKADGLPLPSPDELDAIVTTSVNRASTY